MGKLVVAGAGDLVPFRPLNHVRHPTPESLFESARRATWCIANLEVPLTSIVNPQPWGMRRLRGDPELVADLAAAGVRAVTLANNHSGDQGHEGRLEVAEHCRRNGIACFGFGKDADEAFRPGVVPAAVWSGGMAGADLAIVTATALAPPAARAGAGPGVPGLRVETCYQVDTDRVVEQPGWPPRVVTRALPEDLARLIASVEEARRQTPLVVAVMHWGVTLQERLADYQVEVGHALADAGASVVFGHHAHVLQAVELYRGVPIFYGLGSLLFQYDGDFASRVPSDSALAEVDVDPADGSVVGARLVIGRLDEGGEPVRASPERAEHVHEALRRLSVDLAGRLDRTGATLTLT